MGTPLYFSPEQFFQQPYNAPADIFAIGLVFVNIALGCHPFKGTKQDITRFFTQIKQQGNCDKFCEKIQDLELRYIVQKMLVFDPAQRMTAQELCQQPKVMFYLKQQDLPGPRIHSYYISSRVVKSSSNLPETLRNINLTYAKALKKFNHNREALGSYYEMATALLPKYIYELFLKKTGDKSLFI